MSDSKHADPRNALPEDGDGPAVQTLAHLALVAARAAHRLCRPGEESVRNAVSELEQRLNREIRAAGVELSDEMLDAALDEVEERMAVAEAHRTAGTSREVPVTLDREELREVALDVARIGEAASMADFKYTEDQLRTGMRAAAQKVDDLIDRLYAKAGVTVDDSLLGPLYEEARQWRDDLLDEPSDNRTGRSDDPPAAAPPPGGTGAAGSSPADGSGNRARTVEDADTVELPRELAERLVRQVGLLQAADCTLIDMSPGDFLDVEIARQTAREYAFRLQGTLRDLEERLGYGDGDALTDRLHHECKVLEAAKRAELAEELGGES